ncbi:MAG TPA: redox-sensing transcriptional repressor Rex, partial [Longimicrobiales bacterium]|nr:redox-sensing transcriptional repressor Rex [Longimicrobiales bacterium]
MSRAVADQAPESSRADSTLRLPPPVLERLMRYHRFLAEVRGRAPPPVVTSGRMAAALDIDPTQVRKDLGMIRARGRGRVGYDVDEVIGAIRGVLGFDRTHLAVLVGAGHLGGALMAYRGFARYGLRIVGAFDTDPHKVGRELAGCPIHDVRDMGSFLASHRIGLAILATPVAVSQRVADR